MAEKLAGVQQVEILESPGPKTEYLAGVQQVEVLNPPTTPPLEWKKLTLQNGTQPYDTNAHPHYAIRDGIVYLKGLVNSHPVSGTDGASNSLFTLPVVARPKVTLFMMTRGIGGAHTDFASVLIFTSGRFQISQKGGLSNVSLGGLSFPVE